MAFFRLTIGIQGDTQFDALLGSAKKRIDDWRPFWATIRNFLTGVMQEQFKSEGGRAQKWEPLSVRYAAWKQKNYPGKTILRLTDRLYTSLTNISSPDMVFDTQPQSMLFGTRVPYASKHQLGEGRLKQRRFLSLTNQDRKDIVGLARQWVSGNK
jgi:phage gpG-like protein